jgi:hypothetical protein
VTSPVVYLLGSHDSNLHVHSDNENLEDSTIDFPEDDDGILGDGQIGEYGNDDDVDNLDDNSNNFREEESDCDDRGSDSDFEPTLEDNDEDENNSSDTCTLRQVLETKIKDIFQNLQLSEYFSRTQESTFSRSKTSGNRAAKYFAYAITKKSTIFSDIENFSKKSLLKVLYQKDAFLYEYCDLLSETKSLKDGSIVNILLDILMVGKWLHYYAKIKRSKDCSSHWSRFEDTVRSCRSLWQKKGKRNRRESTKSLEELVSEGKLPRNGIIDIQNIVSRHIALVTAKVETWLQTKA